MLGLNRLKFWPDLGISWVFHIQPQISVTDSTRVGRSECSQKIKGILKAERLLSRCSLWWWDRALRSHLSCGPRCCNSVSLVAVTDEDTVKRYYAKFEEKFFQMCEKELAKINTFYSGKDCSSLHWSACSATALTHAVLIILFSPFHFPYSDISVLPFQKSWRRLSGGSPPCRTSCSLRWTPRGRARPTEWAWGGGRRCSPCRSRSDANTGTSRTCSWPSQSSTSALSCCRTIRCTEEHKGSIFLAWLAVDQLIPALSSWGSASAGQQFVLTIISKHMPSHLLHVLIFHLSSWCHLKIRLNMKHIRTNSKIIPTLFTKKSKFMEVFTSFWPSAAPTAPVKGLEGFWLFKNALHVNEY